MTPEPGTYFVMPGGGFAGWLVRTGTQSRAGHAGLVMPYGKTMEARGGGVAQRELADVIKMGARFSEEPLTDAFRNNVVGWAYMREGAPYDYSVDIDIALHLAMGIRRPFLPVGRHDAYNCSQLVSVGYTACGKIMFPLYDRWVISPKLLDERMADRPWES